MGVKLKRLASQTMVITGASSGIGLTIARRAAEGGAHVILVSRDEDTLKSICDDIRAHGERADYLVGDVGVRDEMRRVVDTVVERHGGFDTWVNDAGVSIYGLLEDTPDGDHQRMFQTNYWGVVYGTLEALRHLKLRGGAIINIGSITSDIPTPLLSAYSASKHAVKGFTDSLRLELIHEGAPVSISLIKPSGIHTPFARHASIHMDGAARVPPPLYHPDVVAAAVLHAAQHPVRDLTVGGVGRLMSAFAGLAPRLSDRVFSWYYFKEARDPGRRKPKESALHTPGGEGRQFGDQIDPARRFSLFTSARMHPNVVAGICLVTAAALIGLASPRTPTRAKQRMRTRLRA